MTYVYDTAPKILQQKVPGNQKVNANNTLHTTSLFITIVKIIESNCNNFTGVIRTNRFLETLTRAEKETLSLDAVCRASTTGTCRGSSSTNGGNFAVIGALLTNQWLASQT